MQYNYYFPNSGWLTVIADDIRDSVKQFKKLHPTIDLNTHTDSCEGVLPSSDPVEETITKAFIEEFDVIGKHELPEPLQKLLIELFLSQPRYYKNCIKQVNQLHLSERSAIEALSFMNYYFEKYNKLPMIELLNAERNINYSGQYKFDNESGDFLLRRLESHLKHKKMDHIKADDTLLLNETINAMLEVQKINFNASESISLISDMDTWLERIKVNGAKHSTGYEHLDNLLGGGCQMPSVNVVAATSGTGKTNMLVNLAINYSLKNFNVCYCHLEAPSEEIAKRATTILTDTVIFNKEFNENIQEVKNKLQQYSASDDYDHEQTPMGLFEIYDIGYGASCTDVQRCLAEFEIKHGRKASVLIVDYIDLLKASSNNDEDRFENDKKVSEEIAGLSKQNNLITWTASQFNRDGMNEAKMTGIAGGISKIYTVDNLFGLVKDNDEIYCFALKTRYSNGAGKNCVFDFNERTMKITDTNKVWIPPIKEDKKHYKGKKHE